MITKRSNHIPTLTRRDVIRIAVVLLRKNLNQKTCGTTTLQVTMIQ